MIKKNIYAADKQEKREIETFSRERRSNPEAYQHQREYKAECGIISYLAFNPDELEYVLSKITPDGFVTSFNKKVFASMEQHIKNSSEFDIMLLQSEFTADEMGKITEITVKNRAVDLSRSAIGDFIDILLEYSNKSIDVKQLSDNDFLHYFEELKKKK